MGADTLTGGTGVDTFVFEKGDSVASIVGTGSSAVLSGFDIIKDFTYGDGTTSGELLSLPGVVNVAANTGSPVNGVDSVDYGQTIASHSITNGLVTFYSDAGGSAAVTIDSAYKVAAAMDYLTHNDLGNAGTTVAFKAVGLSAPTTTDTFVYSQLDSNSGITGANNYSLVKLEGVDASGIGSGADVTNKYIHIE